MTKKISVSLPDDVADYLSEQANASGWLAEAARGRMMVDRTRAAIAATGVEPPPYDPAGATMRAAAEKASVTPELRDAAYQRVAEITGLNPEQVRQALGR